MHKDLLIKAGYDDLEWLLKASDAELKELKEDAQKAGLPPGHALKLKSAIVSRRPKTRPKDSLGTAQTHPPAEAAFPPELVFVKPFAKAAENKAQLAHQERVNALLLSEDSTRLLFGRRKPSQALSRHQLAMNSVAPDILRANPELVRWEGQKLKTGLLLDAAKAVVAASFPFSKSGGSRGAFGGGVEGQKERRRALKAAAQSPAKAASKATAKDTAGTCESAGENRLQGAWLVLAEHLHNGVFSLSRHVVKEGRRRKTRETSSPPSPQDPTQERNGPDEDKAAEGMMDEGQEVEEGEAQWRVLGIHWAQELGEMVVFYCDTDQVGGEELAKIRLLSKAELFQHDSVESSTVKEVLEWIQDASYETESGVRGKKRTKGQIYYA
eukprot:CAMPEP_0172633964 /NCGR_PEP_ID=MMETSP1068-20121228/192091_1 /TAXON_ID=35684 /ORGANISM="Pseudopedinella elastica, Strain CCMP716" /LENGTH=382 /DNA_ID=CAMNT_0013445797 /DNA_START=1 /DNA_END=1149 /DNA_ORIENTATION=+